MADQQLPDILKQIHGLPFDENKRERLFNAFYDDNPKAALEAIQDVPKEIRQSLLSIRGKIYKGEPYDLNDIIKSAGSAPVPVAESAPKGLGEKEETPAESLLAAAKSNRELALEKWAGRIAKPPKPGEQWVTAERFAESKVRKGLPADQWQSKVDGESPFIKNKNAKPNESPFVEKEERKFDDFGRPIQKKGPRLVPPSPKLDSAESKQNTPSKQIAKSGPYITKLSPSEEQEFIAWAEKNNVPFDLSADSDYDMPGFWKALKAKDPRATTEQKPDGLHFPDTWKTPKHETFSNESVYAGPDAPQWKGSKLYDSSGRLIKDESAEQPSTQPPPSVASQKPPVITAGKKFQDVQIQAEETPPPPAAVITLNKYKPGTKEYEEERKRSAQTPVRATEGPAKTFSEGLGQAIEYTGEQVPKVAKAALKGFAASEPGGKEYITNKELLEAGQTMGEPLVKPQLVIPGGDGKQDLTREFTRGALESIGNMTSPANLAILATTKGLGAGAGGATGVSSKSLNRANAALSAYFTGAVGLSAYEHGKEAIDLFKKGEYEEAAKALGVASLDTLFALMGAVHGVIKGKQGIEAFKEGYATGQRRKAVLEKDRSRKFQKLIEDEFEPVPGEPGVVRLKKKAQQPVEAAKSGQPNLTENVDASLGVEPPAVEAEFEVLGKEVPKPAWVSSLEAIQPIETESPQAMTGPPVTATTPPPSTSVAAKTPATQAGQVGSVATVGVKELGLVNPFTGSESTVQVPSSVADKYESLTGPQKEAAAAEILFRTSTPPGNIDNEIQTIKNDLAEIEKDPATIAGLDPYFTSVEDFKSFNNEIVIPYLEYLKTTKAVAEPTTGLEPAKPAVTAPPPATGGGATESKTSATKEITVTNPDGSTEQVAIPEDLANKYESLDGYVKSHADEVILESKDLSSSGIDGFIQQVSTAAQEAEANPDAGVLDAFGGDINALKSYANDFLIPLLKHEKSLKLAAERAAPTVPATAPPPSIAAQPPDAQATVQTSPPSQVPITPQAPPAQQAAGNVAHPKLDDQGQPVIINNPSTPTQDTTWTDPSSTAVFTPEGSTPSKIGNAELKPWSPPQGGWSKVSGTNERLEVRKPFTPDPQKASAAGVIIVEDDGRVWLVSPTNQFGGYDNTFPKGKVEQGLTMQENAIKEAWEETGLKVDIIGVVGDYERSTSKARYYLAVRTGGTPKNMGWESQAVKLTTLQDAKDLLNQQVDKNIISDIEKMTSSGKVAEIKDGTPRKLSSYGPELSKKTGGSNPGGWYQDGSTKWLVKGNKQKTIGTVTLEQSDARASNEVLASKLIQAIDKTGAPDMKLVDLEGKYGSGLGVASKNVPSFKDFDVSNPDHVKAAIKNFATNAWLANYDVLGMGYDNIVITPNGNAMNIDPGGALLFRAQGLPKGQSHGVVNGMLDPSAPEFESMQKTTPEQKEVFGKMTPEQVKESAEQLAKITDEKIVKLVNTYGWGTDAQKAALADNLIQRKNAILQKAGVTTTSSVAPVVQPSPQVTPQPPSSLVATQAQQPPVTATAKLQLGDPTFGMELDASPATVAEYESLSDSDKDNAYNLISGYIGYFEDPTYILNQYPNILSFVQASINTTSNAQVPYSKAVKLYLEDVANQLAGKTNSEQIDIVKQIADQSSGWIAKPPQTASTAATQTAPPPAQAVTQTQQPQTVNISSPAIGVSAIVPNSVALGWGSLTGAGQIDAADVISGAMQNAAYKFMIGDSPAQSLQADINWALQHSSTWYSGVVQDVVVPYLKYIKEELNLKDPSQVLQYISDVGKGWNMVDNWIENVSGYQNYMASQVSQTAPPPSPSVTTQAPPPLQAAPVSQPVQATSPQAQPSTQPATTPAAQLSQSTTAQASTPAQPAQQAPQQVQAMASLLTPHGDFSIPANFLSKYNSMSADNQSSFVKVINKISASRTTTGSSAAAMGFVQDQLDLANQKIAGYDQSISAGTATAFEKERKKYYEELVKPYLEYVLSSGKIAKATGYVAPSGSSLASVSAVPPRPQWVQQYKAQSKGIVAKGEVSNEDALNNYAFLAGLFGKSHSEAKKANTILKNAQKKNGNIQPSIIDQAVQEAKQKYLQFQPFLQVIDKKWIAPIAQYSTEKQPGDEFKFPYSGYVSSVPAGDIDAGKKGKFKAAQDAVVSSLSKTQKNKLKAYTGSLADSVNLSLGQYFNNGYPVPGQVKTAIKTLDSAFKKSKLGENVKLVRNIGSRFFWKWFGMDENGIADHSLDLLKGKSYTEITYASTSMNPDSTVCLQDKSKGKIKLVINAGKNFHGIKVSSFSNVPSEDEVLLPRGTTYVIRDIKRTQSGASPSSNVWEVFVDIVDQTPGEIQ